MAIALNQTRQVIQQLRAVCCLSAIVWLAALPNPVAGQQTCEFFAEPQRFNTQTNGDTIVIGAQPNRRYRVVLNGANETALAEIRACIPDAFATRSRIGPYIQVGSFETRRDAEIIQRILRKEGYRVRVNYVR